MTMNKELKIRKLEKIVDRLRKSQISENIGIMRKTQK
jgi:hypothetical protein